MRSGRVADSYVQGWLDELAAATTHIGLGSDNPFSVMDPLTVEPMGGVYHRSPANLARSSLLLHNTLDLVWPGLPVGALITWYIGWDAAFGGNVTLACPSPLLSFPAGGGFTVGAGEWFFGINA